MPVSHVEIDPRLKDQLAAAGPSGAVEALLMLQPSASEGTRGATHAADQPLLDRVRKTVGEGPTEARFMPRLGVLFVRGTGKFVQELLRQHEVVSASANNEGDVTAGAAKT